MGTRKTIASGKVPKAIAKKMPAAKAFVEDATAGRPHKRNKKVQEANREAKKSRGNVDDPAFIANQWKPGQSGNPAGRPTGLASRISRLTAAERLQLARDYGVTPLEFLLSVMADGEGGLDERIDAAKAAAPYMHRKMPIGVETTGQVGVIDLHTLTSLPPKELDQALMLFGKLGLISPAVLDQFRD